jgi:hypothetical protein
VSEPGVTGRASASGHADHAGAGVARRSLPAVAVIALLAILAGLLRLWSLPSRGEFDADQGTQLLVVKALVEDGVTPLLGPPTSIGDLHHGALYYYLLAPSALVSGTDPPFVTLTIVAAGIGAVLATWWIARRAAGPLAGAVAGGLMALSATAVSGSTFIWNPNLLPLGGALAVAGTFGAWADRRPARWVVAAAGWTLAVQAHVLAHVLALPMLVVLLLDLRRRTGPGERAALGRAVAVAAAVALVGFLPLIANELTTGFVEARAFIAYLGGALGAGGDTGIGVTVRLVVVGLRILSWPLTGLIVDAPVAGTAAAGLVLVLLAWRLVRGSGDERSGMAIVAASLAVGWIALSVVTSSLATVVRDLPVDHYHAFLDPLVFVALGVGLAALARWPARARSLSIGGVDVRPGTTLAGAALVALGGWNVATQPPAVGPDGGWPPVETAGARIAGVAAGEWVLFASLPAVKSPDAYRFAAMQAGAAVVDQPAGEAAGAGAADSAEAVSAPPPTPTVLAVVCEAELLAAVDPASLPCGGPAEDALAVARFGPGATLVDRFEAATGRTVSIYRAEDG